MLKHPLVTSLEAGRLASATMTAPAAKLSVLRQAAQDKAQHDSRDVDDGAQSPLHEPASAR